MPVQTGLWKYFNNPSGYQSICTLTNAQALAVLAFLSAFIAFTQTRWWIITRYILIRLLHPIQLQDHEDPFSLWHLSQPKAIRSLLRRQTRPRTTTMITISPWLGIISILNLVLFIIAGALIPYYLTGSGATPIVLQTNPKSNDDDIASYVSYERIVEFYTSCWFNLTEINEKCGQWATILHNRPQLFKLRNLTCPFPDNICMSPISAIQMEHINLLPVDIGINIEPHLLFGHRVTCSPIQLEFFLNPDQHYQDIANSSLLWFGSDPPPLHNTTWVRASHGRFLRSQNGPNKFSKVMSGRSVSGGFASINDEISGFEIYPNDNYHCLDGCTSKRMHKYLQRLDGTAFVAIFGAGDNIYYQPVDDPLYLAHRKSRIFPTYQMISVNGSSPTKILYTSAYIPDHEATGLGCVEQFQFCANKPQRSCSKWVSIDDWEEFDDIIVDMFPKFENSDIIYLAKQIPRKMSLSRNFTPANELHKAFPYIQYISADWWVYEVMAWMEMALLRARADIYTDSPYYTRRLYHNANYTNIGVFDFTVTISVLFLVCAVSYTELILQFYTWAKLKVPTCLDSLVNIIISRGIGRRIISFLKISNWKFTRFQIARLSNLFSIWPIGRRQSSFWQGQTGLRNIVRVRDIGASDTELPTSRR